MQSNKLFCTMTIVVVLVVIPVFSAPINFGSKASAIVVGDGSIFDINSTNNMEVDAGNITNQGFGVIGGKNINFNHGSYTFFNSVSDLNGSLEPDINKIILQDGTMIANPGGLADVLVHGLPGKSLLRGQPLFFGSNDLTLFNDTTGISLAIQNTLNTNITLNGGLLFLQDDLRLGDDSVILDSGEVQFNSRRLSLGGRISTWNGSVLWTSALDLQLNSAVTLNGTWSFLGQGQINGNGNVIDLVNGGSIVVLADSSLRLAGVHIKGLGDVGKIKIAAGAELRLSDVVIEMEDDYLIDSGTVFVEGNSTIITKDHILTFGDNLENNTSGKLIVDRVALTYDTLASIDKLNIQPPLILDPERKHVEILGQGDIRTIRGDTITFHNYRSDPILMKYAIVAPYRKFQVFPEVDPENFDVVVDGNTNFLGFTRTDEQVFIVTQNVHATMTNIIMRDFSPKHVLLEEGASLVFGDKTNITFARDETLNDPWVFEGNTLLRGAGNILEFGPQGSIELRGANSVLTLDGLNLKGITGNNIRCVDNSSKIVLKNVKWTQSGDAQFATGSMEILDDVTMFGPYTLNYLSTQPLSIDSYAALSLTRNIVFSYVPTTMQFADTNAALSLDQATVNATVGTTLSGGLLIVRDRNFLNNVTIADSMIIDQPAGATLE